MTGITAIWRLGLALVALCLSQAAWAQATTTYVNGTDGNINNTTTCTAPLVRNFTVGTSYTVAGVDIGVFATHTWRGDLRMTLQAPDGTRVQIVNGDTNNISGDNFNVRLDDSAAQTVNTDSATAAHSTAAPPPFANNFAPNNPLSAFAGRNSLGTWRLEICDLYPAADNGLFQHAELYLTSAPALYSDLSLTKAVSNATPAAGATITYTLQVTNAASATATATGVEVTDLLPAGTAYVSYSGPGTYNPGTGVWTVGSVTAGQTRTLTIQATVTAMASATVTNAAEVTANGVFDLDSTPANGAPTEDDYDTVSFTVQGARTPGTPPTLSCPAGSSLFDWDLNAWAAGSLNNSYTLANIGSIGFAIASTGNWVNNASFGGMSPTRSAAITGGLSPTQQALHQYLDFNTQAETADTVITLPTAVPGAQFQIFDIDFNAGQFADRIVVTGRFQGATVLPTLTNGISNYVVGNTAVGDTGSGNTTADGNVTVTFAQPVDTITISYGNATTAPANPGGQAMAIHDIAFCNPVAVLGVTKVSTLISDPTNGTTNPRAMPGAVMEYCILVQNPGSGTATNVIGTDTIPAALTYIAGSLLSGTTCGGATTAEDDDAAGADETDPYGASVSGTVLTATAASLGPSAGFALKFRTTIK
ncbi:MAG: DUF11 domain-containing protein [Qipengyuania sp.]|nr:DUF11 domain-containing protein [Qipengyuania sp.]